jgi:hypothetical protein
MTTPAAGDPAPAAAAPGTAAPAAAPAASVTAPATTAAPAPAPAAETSLIPAAPAGAAPAEPAKEPAKQPTTVTPPANDPEWFYADGTPGKGKMPDWFKADKYKTVDKQAEAYAHLEKRLGKFIGAPEDGKYEFKAPEGLNVELDHEHPLVKELQDWGMKTQLSQEGYNQLLGMLAQYEAAMLPDMGAIKTALGANADTRIAQVTQWAHANLGNDGYATLRTALSQHNAAEVFTVIEQLIAKTVQTALPKPGQDVPAATPGGEAGILAKMRVRGADGKAKYFTDPVYRHQVDTELAEFYRQNQGAA